MIHSKLMEDCEEATSLAKYIKESRTESIAKKIRGRHWTRKGAREGI